MKKYIEFLLTKIYYTLMKMNAYLYRYYVRMFNKRESARKVGNFDFFSYRLFFHKFQIFMSQCGSTD